MKYIKGDITGVERGVLINGVNCQNAMGSGVARAYFMKWPQVKDQYHLWDRMILGMFDPVRVDDELYVANCWTQEFFGSDGGVYADYGAVMASVSQAAMFAKRKNLEVFTPWVGCGLGGLDQERMSYLLHEIEFQTEVPFTLVEL